MEFSTFRHSLEHRHNDSRPRSAKGASPWVPGGPNPSHRKSRGFPDREAFDREVEIAKTAVAEASVGRSAIAERLSGAEAAMATFETKLDKIHAEFDEHMIQTTAAHVLIQKRLKELSGDIVD